MMVHLWTLASQRHIKPCACVVQYDTERSTDAIYERMEDDELDLA